jgi:PEP-CTERM motif
MKAKLLAVAGSVAMAGPIIANAIPVEFRFTDTVGGMIGTNLPGTKIGDSFVLSIFADNGNSSFLSQTWNTEDFLHATLNIGDGAYIFRSTPGNDTFDAQTDASGLLMSIFLLERHGLGGTVVSGVHNIFSDGIGGVADAANLTTPQNFQIFAVTAPEPGTLALFGLGLAGMAVMRRRRAAPSLR